MRDVQICTENITTFGAEGSPRLNYILEKDGIIVWSVFLHGSFAHSRQNNYHVKIPSNQKEVPCQHYCFPGSLKIKSM